jgi:hypothetical protein
MALTFRSQWHRSLYWRIGIAFVAFVLIVLIVQSVMFGYILVRANLQNPGRSPNNVASAVAADLRSALARDPHLDLGSYVSAQYASEPWDIFVVMRSGDTASNSASEVPDEVRQSAEAVSTGTGLDASGDLPRLAGPPLWWETACKGWWCFRRRHRLALRARSGGCCRCRAAWY